jgi:UDP-N-acetylmuramate: L-alanyl-gamma-D-glutamyl-meso-diaminopimelate ligase
MIIEGDEYLTSPIDLRPKFHLYKPNIAIISGIAWDHINVFKTFDIYKEQFSIFIDLIETNGILIYCNEDDEVVNIVRTSKNKINKKPYNLPNHIIREGITYLQTEDGEIELKVFGNHNLLNIESARIACEYIGINKSEFYKHISKWEGAYNRLTKIYDNNNLTIFRDFAHAPSKVIATIDAVKQQFPNRTLIACLELHTFSSLSNDFLPHYKSSMDKSDVPLLYYNPETAKLKKLEMPEEDNIKKSFKNESLKVFTDIKKLKIHIDNLTKEPSVLLMMSSGNFDNMDII